jgi:hypothetical protein
MRITHLHFVLAPVLLCACIGGGKGTATSTAPPTPTVNTLAVVVDVGPVAAGGTINRPYVTVKVCVPGSTTCANVDHVLLDTGSWGLRLVRSVLTASAVTLTPSTDTQGHTIEECAAFSGGQTWGPVALADVTLAGEVASKLPVQILDDTSTGASPPASCGNNGSVHNQVSDILANGILGVGVFAQDCGSACVSPATPPNIYYGCAGTAPGVCTAENVALTGQVTNPVARFAADNNGVIVNLPNLQNANGDATVTGEITFGLGTQADNALPATGLTVLGADTSGDFTATFNGGATALPALIDSGTDDIAFADTDPNMATCTATPPNNAAWVGYYCPIVAPQSLSTVNTGVGVNNATNTVQFAIADPNSFVATATAFINLGGGQGSTRFTWGMPFFYGRKIYIGIDQAMSGTLKGPFYAY